MKTRLRLVLVAMLMATVFVSTLLCGCKNPYGGVITMTEVVTSAMTEWGSLSKRGLTSPAVDVAVINAHNKYRTACAVAAESLRAYQDTGDPNKYINALSAARVAANGVIDIITPLLTRTKVADFTAQLRKANGI